MIYSVCATKGFYLNKTGLVLYGINNIFAVAHGDRTFECVIKGKVLKGTGKSYAPLAPGDRVIVEIAPNGLSRIQSREERTSEICRWNKKRNAPQTLAANADLVVCITSPDEPPFRPRFVDRVHVSCEIEDLPILVVMNKSDLGINDSVSERLDHYEELGCKVLRTSAETGDGIEELREVLAQRHSVICGQSGVGKTSLLNQLLPGMERSVGKISTKYNRGRHTTRFGELLLNPTGGWIVDTPGIREFEIVEIEPADLSFHFPEMAAIKSACVVPGCTHDHEPGCAVFAAVEEGLILEDRYESYLRILESLINREELFGQA